MTNEFNFEQALKDFQDGKALTAKGSTLSPLIKQLTEAALNAELEQHLDNDNLPNRKNGKTSKTIKHASGSFTLIPQEIAMVVLNLN